MLYIRQELLSNYFYVIGSSSEDDETTPRERIQKNSKGFSEFCVRRIEQVIEYFTFSIYRTLLLKDSSLSIC